MIVKFVAENLFITRLWSSICLENIKLIWSIPAFTLEVPARIQLQKRPNIKKSMFQMKTLLQQQIKNFWSFWTWFNYILLFVSNAGLMWWNTTKSFSNIWQRFSCLFAGWFAKICNKLKFCYDFLSYLQDRTANPAHPEAIFCPVLVLPSKSHHDN